MSKRTRPFGRSSSGNNDSKPDPVAETPDPVTETSGPVTAEATGPLAAALNILCYLPGPHGKALEMRAESKGLTADQYAIEILVRALEGHAAKFQ